MFIVLVYDTAAERNPQVLRTCRRYLRWVQRSVFQGELSAAQHRKLLAQLREVTNPAVDSVRIYRTAAPALITAETIGQELGHDDSIL